MDQELKDIIADLAEDRKKASAEAAREMKELRRVVDKVCGKVGAIENNHGYEAEMSFQDVFEKNPVFGGIRYDKMLANAKGFGRNEGIEIDILLINGEAVAVLEVKSRIHPNDVKWFAGERVEKFRKLFPEYANHKAYVGIAGLSFDQKVIDEAKKYGIGIVKLAREGVEITAEDLKAY